MASDVIQVARGILVERIYLEQRDTSDGGIDEQLCTLYVSGQVFCLHILCSIEVIQDACYLPQDELGVTALLGISGTAGPFHNLGHISIEPDGQPSRQSNLLELG